MLKLIIVSYKFNIYHIKNTVNKINTRLVILRSAHDTSRAMLAKAESDMTSQYLPLCCLRRVSYCTASLPLSIKFFFSSCAKTRLFFFFRTFGCCLSLTLNLASALQPILPSDSKTLNGRYLKQFITT